MSFGHIGKICFSNNKMLYRTFVGNLYSVHCT